MPTVLSNFGQLTASLNRMSSKFQTEVKEIIETNLGDIELQAIRDAPGPGQPIKTTFGTETQDKIARGRGWTPISQAIGYSIDPSGYKGRVFVERSAGEIAAWVEFSTGQDAARYLATVPPEWRALAAQYYRNGRGTIVGQPYLLPAFLKYQIQCVKDLKKALKDLRL